MHESKKWEIKTSPPAQIELLVSQLQIPPLIAHLLIQRGFDSPDTANTFLNSSLKDLPDPFLLKDMDKGVSILLDAIDTNKKICIYGDYDVDGTVATSLLYLFFKELGVSVDYYIPHRIHEGYSLNSEALQKIKNSGAEIIITVDNGITSVNEAARARELGLTLIITDHHQVPPILPEAAAVINPQRNDCQFPSKEICGSGVAFYLMMALRGALRKKGFFANRKEPNLLQFMDLLSIATVADVVPLRGVNRIIVQNGLKQMTQTRWPGLKALKDIAQVGDAADAFDLGFKLGPRLNACGRLYEASTGVKLLTTQDPKLALLWAKELDQANRERRGIEADILEEAKSRILKEDKKRSGYVVGDEKWHPGVIGIVASRLVEFFHRPFVLLGGEGENFKGSARSFGELNLVEALRACESHLIKYGGHKAAAGVTLKKDEVAAFTESFDQYAAQFYNEADFSPRLKVDAEIEIGSESAQVYKWLQQLKPFGMGNPEPVFVSRSLKVANKQIVGQKHLKFKVGDSLHLAIAFQQANLIEDIKNQVDIAYYLKWDSWSQKPILHVKDFQI